MPPTVIAKSSDDRIRLRREHSARQVIAHFGGRLPDLPVLCFFDDEDWQALRGPGMTANRGVYFRKNYALFQQLPPYVTEYAFRGGWPVLDDVIYLHGTTCADEIGLTMTFAHELQHFIQHSTALRPWAVNTLASVTLRNLRKSEFDALGLRACDIPSEREARIVAKEVAENLNGADFVRQYIQTKIAERLTEQDATDWECILGLVPSMSYDFATETKRFFPRLRECRAALERVLSALRTDPDFADIDLDALLSRAQ